MRQGNLWIILFLFPLLIQCAFPFNLHAASSNKKDSDVAPVTSWPARDYQESLRTYTQTIKQKPYDAVAYYNRGMVHFALGMHDSAVADFNKAISLRPGELQPYIGKLSALYASGKYRDVLDVADQVLDLFDSHSWGYYWRGRALLAIAQPRKAIEDFNKFLEKEKDPDRISDVSYYLGSAYFESGEYDTAITHLNMAIVKNPLNFENWVLRGIVYKGKLEYAQALRDLNNGFRISKNTSLMACNSIAWILATCPNPEFRNGAEAVKMATIAVNLDDSKPYYHDTLAAAYAELGMFNKAVEEEKKALKLLGKVPDSESNEISARYQKRLDCYTGNKPYRDMEE